MIPEIAPGAATLATPAPTEACRCYHAIQRDFSLPGSPQRGAAPSKAPPRGDSDYTL
jgi:hypothetical protein